MRIILTGATGLIGSRFEELMFENHEIIPLSTKNIKITNEEDVLRVMGEIQADVVIHLAAKTDVDGCEQDKLIDEVQINKIAGTQTQVWEREWSDLENTDTAFAVNFVGTKNLYKVSKKKNIKFVYVSTDFVFKGDGIYEESSSPDPINWYGMTKWFGEKIIDTTNDLVVRLSFPYGYPSPVKSDFVQKLITLLREREKISLIEDQTVTPTFIDDIIYGLEFLLSKDASGVFHLTGSSYENPYRIGQLIKEKLNFKTEIESTTRHHIYQDKAQRPFQSIMKNDKLKHLGFVPKTFIEGLDLIIDRII